MISFEQFKKCTLRYKEQFDLWEEMNNTFPISYTTMIIEDKYVDKILRDQDFFLEQLLGVKLFDWLLWYFYDKPNGPSMITCNDGVEYMIETIDDFLSYMEKEYFNCDQKND